METHVIKKITIDLADEEVTKLADVREIVEGIREVLSDNNSTELQTYDPDGRDDYYDSDDLRRLFNLLDNLACNGCCEIEENS